VDSAELEKKTPDYGVAHKTRFHPVGGAPIGSKKKQSNAGDRQADPWGWCLCVRLGELGVVALRETKPRSGPRDHLKSGVQQEVRN